VVPLKLPIIAINVPGQFSEKSLSMACAIVIFRYCYLSKEL
jgi:hypothetical protein